MEKGKKSRNIYKSGQKNRYVPYVYCPQKLILYPMELKYRLNGLSHGLCAKGCGRQDKQLNTYDYLADIPGNAEATDLVEVQFKNTRKGYYRNTNQLPLEKGDIVAVEASPGHDIGVVTLTGRLVPLQIKKANLKPDQDIKRIYRKAKPTDLEKYEEAKAREHDTMIRSRQIAKDLGLEMKIGDVEYQGDGNKAIFYYIADGRVDFRQLIKVLAEAFHVRIEMKQIGARQEAGRIGGIGPCGRELCCATWMKNFVSVSTSAARYQDISLNPQKLAGQCAKLKCCMNYEVDTYVEAGKRLPSREITLQTQDGEFYFFKSDILSGTVTYSSDKNIAANLTTISARRAFEIISMNRRNEKPEKLAESERENTKSADLVEQESLTRFDKRKKGKKDNRRERNGSEARDNEPNSASPEKENRQENANRKNNENRKNKNNRQDQNHLNNNKNEQQKPAENRQPKNNKPKESEPQKTNNRKERTEQTDKPEQAVISADRNAEEKTVAKPSKDGPQQTERQPRKNNKQRRNNRNGNESQDSANGQNNTQSGNNQDNVRKPTTENAERQQADS